MLEAFCQALSYFALSDDAASTSLGAGPSANGAFGMELPLFNVTQLFRSAISESHASFERNHRNMEFILCASTATIMVSVSCACPVCGHLDTQSVCPQLELTIRCYK